MAKTFKNKLNGRIVILGDNTPVPANYEPYNGKPCGNCGVESEVVSTVIPETIESSFVDVETEGEIQEVETETKPKKKGKI